jgi:hypothetical protein
MVTRDEMKAKRLKAMGVVATQTQANSDMYDRIIAGGEVVAKARDMAETVHAEALLAQVADLKEMHEELGEFAQAVPTAGGSATTAPAAKPSSTSALDALMTAQPNPGPDFGTGGDAYVGTRPSRT